MRSWWIRVIGTVLVGGQLHAAEPEFQFVDRTVELGLEPANATACWVDVNNDDWPELCVGGTVWRNERGRRFSRVAEGMSAVIAADIDNDGVDLYSTPAFKWFRNRGGETFDAVVIADLPRSISLGAAFADLDGDAIVDLYAGGYELWEANVTFPSLQLVNVGGTGFRLRSTDDRFRARGVTACDFDDDGDVDVYVSNYRLQPNRLWINDGQGILADESAARNALATAPGFSGGHSIGAVWGDFDNDGRFDRSICSLAILHIPASRNRDSCGMLDRARDTFSTTSVPAGCTTRSRMPVPRPRTTTTRVIWTCTSPPFTASPRST